MVLDDDHSGSIGSERNLALTEPEFIRPSESKASVTISSESWLGVEESRREP